MTDLASQFTDARGLLYRPGLLDPDGARRLTAQALSACDDGELYLQYRASESFGFDDGRLLPHQVHHEQCGNAHLEDLLLVLHES